MPFWPHPSWNAGVNRCPQTGPFLDLHPTVPTGTAPPLEMRAKKHLREAALEAMRQEKRARVDEVEAVQEHFLKLISRVADA